MVVRFQIMDNSVVPLWSGEGYQRKETMSSSQVVLRSLERLSSSDILIWLQDYKRRYVLLN
jgi:hypothetical protein